MNPWKPMPMVRLLIPFAAGVIFARTGSTVNATWIVPVISVSVVTFLLVLVLVEAKGISYRYHWIPGLLIGCSLILLGAHTILITGEKRSTGLHEQVFAARITEPPHQSGSRIKLTGRVYLFDTLSTKLYPDKKMLLSLPHDTAASELRYGDWVLLRATLRDIPASAGRGDFDAAGYWGLRGVFSQAWVETGSWKQTGIPSGGSIQKGAFRIRDKLLEILRTHLPVREEFAVASAILLGYTTEIDPDLKKGFAASGAMHILSVSGMHVGIIFIFLETLFRFLNRRRHGPGIKALLMILMIWIYSFVTGLSPPVFRAALMITMLILGNITSRRPDSLNTMSASMFVMLLTDPMLIFHLGFQFSYLAVAGILLFYKPIFTMFRIRVWGLSTIWALVSVSIAAQLSTFPLALHAFHQFPNYFLIANLVVVPLTSLVIYSGIGVIAFSSLPEVSGYVAFLLGISTRILNSVVRMVEGLPGATLSGIYLTGIDTILIYILIISGYLFIRTRKGLYFLFSLTIILVISGERLAAQVLPM